MTGTVTTPILDITGVISSAQDIGGTVSSGASLNGVITIPTSGTPYTGAYTFTPSAAAQVVEIKGLVAKEDITINPIPSNYGLITWNGSTLTVS